jgi:hypothetical protein
MTHKAVLKQVKIYLAYADESSCINYIKTSIADKKRLIKDNISEGIELARDSQN